MIRTVKNLKAGCCVQIEDKLFLNGGHLVEKRCAKEEMIAKIKAAVITM